ncbi:hypothetical protein ACO22_04745 [Paracoccidioides brasiliensis]|uniref:Uncharacterized protein n=1 Tax=Paracoccidioides brasiliensis TaxID=121759 RepID=A0A1D2JCH4_PARBR|nr:hypothetical protein ACO22_04745 [Paracoccidioides brasiliensis]
MVHCFWQLEATEQEWTEGRRDGVLAGARMFALGNFTIDDDDDDDDDNDNHDNDNDDFGGGGDLMGGCFIFQRLGSLVRDRMRGQAKLRLSMSSNGSWIHPIFDVIGTKNGGIESGIAEIQSTFVHTAKLLIDWPC